MVRECRRLAATCARLREPRSVDSGCEAAGNVRANRPIGGLVAQIQKLDWYSVCVPRSADQSTRCIQHACEFQSNLEIVR